MSNGLKVINVTKYSITPVITSELFYDLRPLLDVRCDLTLIKENPAIAVIDNFMTKDECDQFIEECLPLVERSGVLQDGATVITDHRTSSGCWVMPSDIVAKIDQRIETLFQWPILKSENFNFLAYKPGDVFKKHHDFIADEFSEISRIQEAGQRVATVIIYLNDADAGETEFPTLDLKVFPKRGRLLFFAYPRAVPECDTLHAGNAPVNGDKYIAVKWFREKTFN